MVDRDGVGHHHAADRRGGKTLVGLAHHDRVRGGADDVGGPVVGDNGGRLAEGPGRRDHVVDHEHGAAIDVANHVSRDDIVA